MPVPNIRSDYAGGQSTTFADSGAQMVQPFSIADQLKALMGAEQQALMQRRVPVGAGGAPAAGRRTPVRSGSGMILRENVTGGKASSGIGAENTYGKNIQGNGGTIIGGVVRVPEWEPGAVFTGHRW